MYRDTRREYIVRLLRNKDECSVSDLANYFSVTKETIRTDLAWLQKRGVVSRHHGGVSLKKHLMQNALSQQEYVDMSLLIKQQQQGIGYLTSLDDKGRRMVGKVCVLGSFNVDIVAKVYRFPNEGETLVARETTMGPGGKGANQALAAHRAGAQIHFACKIGRDQFNHFARNHIESIGIGSFTFYESELSTTGCAVIYVNDEGENMIAMSPGANHELSDNDIIQLSHFIAESDVFIVQMENNLAATQLALKCAQKMQVTTILNPAPWSSDVATLLPFVDIVTPNETEASAMSGMVIDNISDAVKAAKHIYNAGQCSVIITMGKRGALIYDGQR